MWGLFFALPTVSKAVSFPELGARPCRKAGLCFFPGARMKTYVYVDGFNLYYGAVKGTPFKWLDIRQLCQLLLPKHRMS